MMHHGLHRFGDECLEDVALDGQAQARHSGDMGGVPGDGDADFAAENSPPRGFDADGLALVHDKSGHFAVLNDVDAQGICGAGIAPGHGVMAHGAGPLLQDAAPDGPAGVLGIIEVGQQRHDLAAVQQFRVDAVEAHDVAAPGIGIELHRAGGEHDLAAVGDHAVEIQFMGEAFPELQGMLEKLGVAVDHVVGADERGVAADVAGTDIGALEHGHIAHPVVLGEVIGGGEAMAAAADDDGIVGALGLRRAPRRAPRADSGEKRVRARARAE